MKFGSPSYVLSFRCKSCPYFVMRFRFCVEVSSFFFQFFTTIGRKRVAFVRSLHIATRGPVPHGGGCHFRLISSLESNFPPSPLPFPIFLFFTHRLHFRFLSSNIFFFLVGPLVDFLAPTHCGNVSPTPAKRIRQHKPELPDPSKLTHAFCTCYTNSAHHTRHNARDAGLNPKKGREASWCFFFLLFIIILFRFSSRVFPSRLSRKMRRDVWCVTHLVEFNLAARLMIFPLKR